AIHYRAMPIDHGGIHHRPCLRVEVEHLGGDSSFEAARGQDTAVRQDEEVRVFRESIGSARHLHPCVGSWSIDLWDGSNTGRTAVAPRHDKHTTVRQRYGSRIPATEGHRWDLRPAAWKCKDIRVTDAVKVGKVTAHHEHTTVG